MRIRILLINWLAGTCTQCGHIWSAHCDILDERGNARTHACTLCLALPGYPYGAYHHAFNSKKHL